MHLGLDFIFFALAVLAAVVALGAKDLLICAIALGVFSYLSALLYNTLGAVDVGFNEAVLGAGVTGILFIAAIFYTRRRDRSPVPRRRPPAGLVPAGIALLAAAAFTLYKGMAGLPLRPVADVLEQRVSGYYLGRALADMHTPNVVTAIIADYRAFDTLGETLVIFTAALACLTLMGKFEKQHPSFAPTQSLIVDTVIRLLIPLLQLFALYVVFHGHHSPGGGFQGGALLGISLILKRLFLPLSEDSAAHDLRLVTGLSIFGLLLFSALGLTAYARGGQFLNYAFLPFPLAGAALRSAGISAAEIGIAFTVASSLLLIFNSLAKPEFSR